MIDVKVQPFGPDALNGGEKKPHQKQGGSSFGEFLQDSIKEVNRLQNEADKQITDFSTGKTEDIHGVMLSLQKADLSFRLMNQIRGKLVEAYKEVTRMGV